MAVISTLLLAASLLTPLAKAVPRFNRNAIHTHTEIETAWVTVEETTTIWLDPSNPTTPPAPVVPEVTNSSVPPAVFAQPTYTPSTLATVAAAPSVEASSVVASSVVASSVVASSVVASSVVASSVAASPVVASVVASSVEAPSSAPVASPTSLPSTSATPVDQSTSAPEASSVQVQPKDVSSTGTCEGSGNACVGDVTHWDGGLGACGWNVDTNSEMQIALPVGFMGSQSNGNPYCGRSVTLYNPTSGTTVQATVGDKCMGCVDRAIDCTNTLFSAITDGKGDGRESGIQWWLN